MVVLRLRPTTDFGQDGNGERLVMLVLTMGGEELKSCLTSAVRKSSRKLEPQIDRGDAGLDCLF